MTTGAFIAALKRLVGRGGKLLNMHSDNGANFIGANRELRRLHKLHVKEFNKVTEELGEDGLKWKFIPPSCPHFAGLWEAAAKSKERHIKILAGIAI